MRFALLFLLISPLSSIYAKNRPSEAIGHYARGKIKDASELPNEGHGFVKILRPRNRGYGTDELISFIQEISFDFKVLFPTTERIQVGDIASKTGGQLARHKSHQNGLDADIVYMRKNHLEQKPDIKHRWVEYFVFRKKVTKNFDVKRNWELLKLVAQHPQVDRIFVDRVIKNKFCSYSRRKGEFKSYKEVLRKLRHEPYHKTHFHVRIKCPEGNNTCRDMRAIPAGSGC